MLVPRLHLVTDRRLVTSLKASVAAALAGLPAGQVAVHLREKDLGGRELLLLARELERACHRAGQLLVVNDRLDVALAAGADGVHLPASGPGPAAARRLGGPALLVGVSCHGAADVARAADEGADYATFGPVFDTPSKRRFGPPVGIEALRTAVGRGLPLVALGGVSRANGAAALAAGAAGLGVIRAWLAEGDPGEAVRALLQTLRFTMP